MPTSEPLHVAFVWHMHQPYYRSARTGAFGMPWARLHALKDYLDMVETLSAYPSLRQTFNLVPSLVEQLEDYASGDFTDVYWDLTMKPAAELGPAERAFVVERMCEHSGHLRSRLHPRYLELAHKREAASPDWVACAAAFTADELRDLQVWFNLAWFDPQTLAADPLRQLVERGRDFREEDKQVLAAVQADILARVLPAYRDAAFRGQIELSTSPYFHPILPLLCNSDSARIASPDVVLPSRRFAHPGDAAEQIKTALDKHVRVFGEPPLGMWCSEQAVGEDVLPLLIEAGLSWTISDETVLARSVSGVASAGAPPFVAPSALGPASPYFPYRLERETGNIAIVFRDHTLSDLIGFTYQSWDSRDAAADLLRRLRELRTTLVSPAAGPAPGQTRPEIPLVTIALDGENAWEYYPHDGRDFLRYLYEGISSEEALRCVTVSEHLREHPPGRSLDWLHTGSWIGGDLRTWCGDKAHNAAWGQLGRARDLASRHLQVAAVQGSAGGAPPSSPAGGPHPAGSADPGAGATPATAWHHILVAEGSDWFWWFGDHHRTELDHVWDRDFRSHLQEVYRCLGEPMPVELLLPLLEQGALSTTPPLGPVDPVIDGRLTYADEWASAGLLSPVLQSTMQPSVATTIEEVRIGWSAGSLCLLVKPGSASLGVGLEIELRVTQAGGGDELSVLMTLGPEGQIAVSCTQDPTLQEGARARWGDVIEAAIPLDPSNARAMELSALVLRIGRDGVPEHVFHAAGLAASGLGGQ
jgi:alpha-amylase/alpha-mannosidase (GH57 family)